MIPAKIPPTIFKAALQLFGSAEQETALFREGDLVEGRVLKILSSRQALVRLSGVEMLALTESRMTPGQNIVGRIERVSPSITVSLLQGESARDLKTSALMRLLLPSKAPMGQVMANLSALGRVAGAPPGVQQALDTLTQNIARLGLIDPETATADTIRDTIRNSGLFLEATLRAAVEGNTAPAAIRSALAADLKALAVKTLTVIEGEIAALVTKIDARRGAERPAAHGPETAQSHAQNFARTVKTPAPGVRAADPDLNELLRLRDAARTVRDLVNNIELNQLVNAATKEKGGAQPAPTLFQLPFLEGMNMETARVYIRPRKEGKGAGAGKKEGESTVVFMLNMSRLGPVRLDANVREGRVTGSIYAVNDAVARYLTGRLDQLTGPLEQGGYQARFEVATAARAFVTEELENYTPIIARGVVDVRA